MCFVGSFKAPKFPLARLNNLLNDVRLWFDFINYERNFKMTDLWTESGGSFQQVFWALTDEISNTLMYQVSNQLLTEVNWALAD